jgi:hypothetical protein
MKWLSNLLMFISGLVAAPFLVYLLSRYITDVYPWIPFMIIIVIAAVLGVGILRSAGAGLVAGTILFGVFIMWWHRGLDWAPHYVRGVRKPF